MKKRYAFIGSLLLLLAACTPKAGEPAPEPKPPIVPMRGVWITNVASSAMTSRENIRKTVQACQDAGLNYIFLVVWNKGRTLYPSAIMKNLIGKEIADAFVGRDPLQEMIEEAHAKGIKVFAWFEYGFACSYNEQGGLILQAKPEWTSRDQSGKLLNKSGFEWMNPFHPEVQDFMISLVCEVVNNYAVDGVQGDDRMPALPVEGGYDDYTKTLYRSENAGAEPPMGYSNSGWIAWRVGKLNLFQKRLYEAVKAARSTVVVSNAPSVHPWAKENYLQDWPTWLAQGHTDMVIPQHYRKDISSYQTTLNQQLSFVSGKDRTKFYPGVLILNGAESPTLEMLIQMVQENRRQGVMGESFWFYEGLAKFPTFFADYKSGKYN